MAEDNFKKIVSHCKEYGFDGARFLGNERIPYHPKDVEAYMAENKQ